MKVRPNVKRVTPPRVSVLSFFRIDFSPSRIKVGAWARRALLRFLAPFAFFTAPLPSRFLLAALLVISDRLRERSFVRFSLGLPRRCWAVTNAGYSRDNSRRLRRSALRSTTARPLPLPLR